MPRNVTPSVKPGDRFGLWTVIATSVGYSGRKPGSNPKDLVRCDCGREREIPRQNLKRGNSKSCGYYPCYLQVEGALPRGNPAWRKHGASSDPIYGIWKSMRARCRPGHKLQYYERGIRVTPEWEDFFVFYEYINEELGPRPDGASLGRIEKEMGYEPGNVKWVEGRKKRKGKETRPKWTEAYKRNGPSREPEPLRVRPVHVPPHLKEKGWS